MKKEYMLRIKDNVLDIKLNNINLINNQEQFMVLIEEIKNEISDILFNYEDVMIVINDFNEYYILSIVDEFNKNNITISYRDYVENMLDEEKISILTNFNIDIIIDYQNDLELWKTKIKETLKLQNEENQKTQNTSITIYPIFEIYLNNIFQILGKEHFNNITVYYYFDNIEEKSNFIKNIKIEEEELKKLFPEYFETKILIK